MDRSEAETQSLDLSELSRRYYRCEGYRLEVEFRGLALSFRTYKANGHEVVKALQWFENAFPNPLMVPSKERELHEFCYEVVRLFQNAVTAGQSFLDHSLTSIRRRYRGQPFHKEYESEHRRRIKDVPVCQFVEALRGFQLHNQSISPSVSRGLMGFPFEDSPMCQITLNTDSLKSERKRWKDKHPKALDYLDALRRTTSIEVDRLITDYDKPVSEFREWHRGRELEINAAALSEARVLREQMAALRPDLARLLLDFDPNARP